MRDASNPTGAQYFFSVSSPSPMPGSRNIRGCRSSHALVTNENRRQVSDAYAITLAKLFPLPEL